MLPLLYMDRNLLVCDSASIHCTTDMKNCFAEKKIGQMVPEEMTDYL